MRSKESSPNKRKRGPEISIDLAKSGEHEHSHHACPSFEVPEGLLASSSDDTESQLGRKASKAAVKPRLNMESSGKTEAAGQSALAESTGTKGIGGGSKLSCLLNCKSSDGLDKR